MIYGGHFGFSKWQPWIYPGNISASHSHRLMILVSRYTFSGSRNLMGQLSILYTMIYGSHLGFSKWQPWIFPGNISATNSHKLMVSGSRYTFLGSRNSMGQHSVPYNMMYGGHFEYPRWPPWINQGNIFASISHRLMVLVSKYTFSGSKNPMGQHSI